MKAPRGSRRVRICVKSGMMKAYKIEIIDKAIEGIIGLHFEHRVSDCFVVFSCYFPPEQG